MNKNPDLTRNSSPTEKKPAYADEKQIPPWLKWEYAARCYKIKERSAIFIGQTFHGAVYLARNESTRLATQNLEFNDPKSDLEMIEKLELSIKDLDDEKEKIDTMFLVVQAAQRTGFVDIRDRWLKKLKAEKQNPELKTELEKFENLIQIESQYQQQYASYFKNAYYNNHIAYNREPIFLYLIAEAYRRTGQPRPQVFDYYLKIIEKRRKTKKFIIDYSKFFIDYLNR